MIHKHQKGITTLGALLAIPVFLLGVAMAQGESAEDDMDMGPCEELRTFDAVARGAIDLSD